MSTTWKNSHEWQQQQTAICIQIAIFAVRIMLCDDILVWCRSIFDQKPKCINNRGCFFFLSISLFSFDKISREKSWCHIGDWAFFRFYSWNVCVISVLDSHLNALLHFASRRVSLSQRDTKIGIQPAISFHCAQRSRRKKTQHNMIRIKKKYD